MLDARGLGEQGEGPQSEANAAALMRVGKGGWRLCRVESSFAHADGRAAFLQKTAIRAALLERQHPPGREGLGSAVSRFSASDTVSRFLTKRRSFIINLV